VPMTSTPKRKPAASSAKKHSKPAALARKPTKPARKTVRSAKQARKPAASPRKPRSKVERVTRVQIAEAQGKAVATFARLRALYPDAHCELDHQGSFQLIVSVVLSAQTTDVLVNKVTPHLFTQYPDAPSLGAAEPAAVAQLLASRGLGMYNQKGKNIASLARLLVERHGGQVPRTLAELVELPGVGRKTANVVLGVAFNTPEGVVVDTHVMRLAQRLGWTKHTEPVEIEQDLMALFPREDWDMLSHALIFHGRRCCYAQRPACAACGVSDVCPSAFRAETIGRKALRVRA
jgi:endonuclease-3